MGLDGFWVWVWAQGLNPDPRLNETQVKLQITELIEKSQNYKWKITELISYCLLHYK